jgi:hypothetical protein
MYQKKKLTLNPGTFSGLENQGIYSLHELQIEHFHLGTK